MLRSRDDYRMTRRTILRLLGGAAGVAALGTAIGCAPASQPAAPAPQSGQPAGQQAPAQAQQTFKLKFAHSLSPTMPLVAVAYVGVMETVTQRTNGRVTWEHYPAEQFGKALDLPDMTRTGAIDMSTYATAYTVNKFPLAEMFELPGMHQDPVAATRAAHEVTMQYFADGYIQNVGIHPLNAFLGVPGDIVSRKPIQKLADLKGLKIGAVPAGDQRALALLGAVPVKIIHTERYESLSRNVVDGMTGAYSSLITDNLGEVAKYATMGARMGVAGALVAASEKTWQKLPEDIRKVLVDVWLEKMLEWEGQAWRDNLGYAEQAKAKFGMVFHTLPLEEQAVWRQALTPLYDEWLNEKEKQGHKNAREVFGAYRQLVQKYEAEGAGAKKP
ncbi:MAG: TRAP transporter substrate-binding protein DctP [Chloroflexi bacterium]|nr:TRAP transporter substrate-binding protein DctP [Chloroflexota bacterium]